MSNETPTVIVVGSGMAGLASSLSLAKSGFAVTLLEAAPRPGGRLGQPSEKHLKFDGKEFVFPIEHGLHGIWKPYNNLRALIDFLGLSESLVPVPSQGFIYSKRDGTMGELEVGARYKNSLLPDPIGPASLMFDMEFAREVLAEGPQSLFRCIRDLTHSWAYRFSRDRHHYDSHSVEQFVYNWPRPLRRLFGALAHTGFFCEPNEVSLAAILSGLEYYVNRDKQHSAFDVFNDSIGPAFLEPALARLVAEGGEVHMETSVSALHFVNQRFHSLTTGNESSGYKRWKADALVLAVDPGGFGALVHNTPLSCLKAVAPIPETVPTASVRFWLTAARPSRAVTGILGELEADAFFWLSDLQKPFQHWAAVTGGSVVELHLYGNRALGAVYKSDEQVLEECLDSITQIWPTLAGTCVGQHLQRNRSSHPKLGPGTVAREMPVATNIPNVALCGDWVDCGAPALYLERACVTGLQAAQRTASILGKPRTETIGILPALSPSKSYSFLSPISRCVLHGLPPIPKRLGIDIIWDKYGRAL